MFIAFSFGAFIEGAAGFGAPVAVSGAMLAGLGFNPFYAAGICLLANTAPVAFGSIGIPVMTLANVTGLPVAVAERDGRPAVRDGFGVHSRLPDRRHGGPEARAGSAAGDRRVRRVVRRDAVLRVELRRSRADRHRQLAHVHHRDGGRAQALEAEEDHAARGRGAGDDRAQAAPAGEIFMAWLPYLLLVVFVLAWGEPSIKPRIDAWTDGLLPASLPSEREPTLQRLNVPGAAQLIQRCRRSSPRRRRTRPCSPSTG